MIEKQSYFINAIDEQVEILIASKMTSQMIRQPIAAKQHITIIMDDCASATLQVRIEQQLDVCDYQYHIFMHQKSSLQMNIVLITHAVAHIKIFVHLLGQNSCVDVTGAYVLLQSAQCYISTLQKHQAIASQSKIILKGFLKDHAIAQVDGLIFVDSHAKKTYALQENKNLIVSAHATVKTIPSIEVLNNDVQCFHGAATASYQKEHTWYLATKGFDSFQANSILVYSFFYDVVQGCKDNQSIMELICKKIM